jgi:cell division septum initiation protein DivIVA
MDILHLIDRLEELFNESRPIPLTHNVIVDEDKFLDLIDQMRIAIPEEIKKAQQIAAQKDRVMAQAQEEANRTLQLAREKADQLVSKDQIAQEAQRRASQIIDQARMDAENIKNGADQYALDALASLADQLERLLVQVRNGMRMLEEKRPPIPSPTEILKSE